MPIPTVFIHEAFLWGSRQQLMLEPQSLESGKISIPAHLGQTSPLRSPMGTIKQTTADTKPGEKEV